MSEVSLQINGQAYGGWTSVRIERGIEQMAGRFSLAVTERWPDQPTARPIHPGDACRVSVDGETLITGFVDDVEPGYSSEDHTVQVSGRDATGDLVDCAADYGQWKGQTLAQLARTLCRPFGITVTDLAHDDYVFTALETDSGETVFDLLDRAARHAGVLLVSDGAGGLVITRTGTARAPTALELGRNILAGRGAFSHRDRFSEYRVIGQAPGTDSWNGADASEPVATVTDDRIRRYRPTIVDAEETITPAQASRRAQWQRNVAFGRSLSVSYTLAGWRHAGGLWSPNELVTVADSFMGLTVNWLIVAVAFSMDGSEGELTELTLMPPEAFDLTPLPEESADDAWAL